MTKIRRRLTGVYILGSEELSWFKIGTAYDIDNRTQDVRAGLPFDAHVFRKYLIEPRQALEKFLHAHLVAMRLRGEWFACEKAELLKLCDELVAKFQKDAPWTHTARIEQQPLGTPREKRHGAMQRKLASILVREKQLPLEKRIAEVEQLLLVAKAENEPAAVSYLTQLLRSLQK